MDRYVRIAFDELSPPVPAGFEPKQLSCCHCGDDRDRINLADPNLMSRVVRAWFERHAKCEEKAKPKPGFRE